MASMSRPNPSLTGLLFLPPAFQSGNAIRWLKRVHAWTGLWGALLFLMLGLSGSLLNHRSILKIDTGKPVEVSAVTLPVAAGTITDEKTLGIWAKRTLNLPSEPKTSKRDDAAPKMFNGKTIVEPTKWSQTFRHPNGMITVDYVVGSTSVAVRQDADNVLGVIKNLHKGTGVGMAWVLFMDSIAGALVAMSVTGFLLWSRFHGTRLIAGGIIVASLTCGVVAVWPFILGV
jgi:uncharacterized protein